MTEKEKKELEKFVNKICYNNDLKDLYLIEILYQDKDYLWDQISDQTLH